jgi:hypothetical protein
MDEKKGNKLKEQRDLAQQTLEETASVKCSFIIGQTWLKHRSVYPDIQLE